MQSRRVVGSSVGTPASSRFVSGGLTSRVRVAGEAYSTPISSYGSTRTLQPSSAYAATPTYVSPSVQSAGLVSSRVLPTASARAFPSVSSFEIARPAAPVTYSAQKATVVASQTVSGAVPTYSAPVAVAPVMPQLGAPLSEDRIVRAAPIRKGDPPPPAQLQQRQAQPAAALVEQQQQQGLVSYCLLNAFVEADQCQAPLLLSPDDITVDWLNLAMNCNHLTGFNLEVCEQGQCALTVLVKDIQYAGDAQGYPASLAIKMHGQTDEQRLMFSNLGHFTKEVFFYTSFAGQVPLDSPRVYGVWTDGNGLNLTDAAAPQVEYFNLMMEDMNTCFKAFNCVVDGAHSSVQETEEMLMMARDMHVKFLNDPVIYQAPFSKTGSTFSLDAKRPYVGYATASWPPVRENMPALAGWESFPDHAAELVAFYDNFLSDEGRLASRLVDALEALWCTRPLTLNHGDFNCGNVWQDKSNPQAYCFADWQLYEMAPIGLDIESMLITLGDGNIVNDLMDKYHMGLPAEIQAAYTRTHLQEDFKGQLAIVAIIIVAIMAGQLDPNSMPAEKHYFCWKILWPKAFYNFGTLFRDLQVMDFVNALIQ